ncbi:MAG: Veg family protein [Clostridia bacterium]
MKKTLLNIDQIRDSVQQLLGKEVAVKYNKGRNKIVNLKGKISEAYANVFVLLVHNEIFDRLSCSYTDIMCGEIKIKELKT